jgi:cell wall-active antibiotic response 4TMS protein YvqF
MARPPEDLPVTDPIDDTQPHDTTERTPLPPAPTSTPPPPASEPPLRADPDRPADPGWREPAWFPPRERQRRPSVAAVVFGLALIAIGLWFFLDRTLGVDLPRIQWGTIWPVILIVIGGLILLRSFQRRA